MIKHDNPRSQQDLSHLIYQTGFIGPITTLSVIPVLPGDSFSTELVGSFKMSPMRRNLTLDPNIEIFSFYVPHRHCYSGTTWEDFVKAGPSTPTTPNLAPDETQTIHTNQSQYIALGGSYGEGTVNLPIWRTKGYELIFNNYFKRPDQPDETPNWTSATGQGLQACHLKNIWTTPIASNKDANNAIDSSGATINLSDIAKQGAAFSREQEMGYFTQRYRDIVDSYGGKTNADVDQRPTLLARTKQFGSGYDVDGTSETSLGQFVGRVSTSVNHTVPRTYIPEWGAVWTIAVVRMPTVVVNENNYLSRNTRPTWEDIICDSTISQNMLPVDLPTNSLFTYPGASMPATVKVPHGQWYRETPGYVADRFHLLGGFPFFTNPSECIASGAPWKIRSTGYDDIFQTGALDHWNMCMRNNVKIVRNVPTARSSIMTMEN